MITLKSLIVRLAYTNNHQDITCLSYPKNFFDLVIHSETLEHVIDVDKALSECLRVLRPGGYCLFTIPIIPDRLTVQRITASGRPKKIKYIKPPSYHGNGIRRMNYLVCWEFGGDFISKYKVKTIISYPEHMLWVFGIKKEENR